MKTSTLPPLRVTGELRRQAEAVLEAGETLSAMVHDAVTRSIEFRRTRREFIERGLASSAAARSSGKYVPAGRVLGKLARRLEKAKSRSA